MNNVLKVYLVIYYFVNLVLAFWATVLRGQHLSFAVDFVIVGFWVFAALVLLGLYLTKLVKFRKGTNKLGLFLATPVVPWALMKVVGAFE